MQYNLAIAPTTKKPLTQSSLTAPWTFLFQQISANFSLSTLLLAGACLQAIALLVFQNHRYAFAPAFFLLGVKLVDSVLIAYNVRPNPYMKNVFLGRTTAFVPDEDGNLGDKREKVTVMLLGAKTNHPFGVFNSQFMKVGKWLGMMGDEFNADQPPKGFLGQTNWERKDENGAREFNFISYWRTIEDLHDYAHSPLHREAWLWWEKTLKENNCIGINHEIFQADGGQWETVYANWQPNGLGASTVLRKGDIFQNGVVGEQWITPLVNAQKGKLAKSSARLGWDPIKYDADRPNGAAYA